MQTSRNSLSVVIVSYNIRPLLARCLASIAAEPHPPDEVIVVDNASADDSVALVREQFPHVQVIANEENRGFAVASNQGLRAARGTFLCLLNPDTQLFPGALDALATFPQRPSLTLAWWDRRSYTRTAGISTQHFAFPRSPWH